MVLIAERVLLICLTSELPDCVPSVKKRDERVPGDILGSLVNKVPAVWIMWSTELSPNVGILGEPSCQYAV